METVVIPNKAIARQFVHEKTGSELTEIILPEQLPKGSPDCGGWHFYMPGYCVEQIENGARLKFPPAWRIIRILSPYVEGKRIAAIESPTKVTLAQLRAMFAQHKKQRLAGDFPVSLLL